MSQWIGPNVMILFEILWWGVLVQFLMWEPLCKVDENDHCFSRSETMKACLNFCFGLSADQLFCI